MNKEKIAESYLSQFPECKTPEEANTQLKHQIALITSQISELNTKTNQLEPEIPIDKLNEVNLKKGEEERLTIELTTCTVQSYKDS